jgi:nucleotide-binding universal stress UspA family protein
MREQRPIPLVVVGVDGSDVSAAVLRWARNQAKATGGRLRVVYGWHVADQSRDVPLRMEAELDRAAQRRVGELVAAAAPDVPVEHVVEETAPADLLLREAKGADLLVLGSAGHRRAEPPSRGSVVQTCLDRATCPVVVVPVAQPV